MSSIKERYEKEAKKIIQGPRYVYFQKRAKQVIVAALNAIDNNPDIVFTAKTGEDKRSWLNTIVQIEDGEKTQPIGVSLGAFSTEIIVPLIKIEPPASMPPLLTSDYSEYLVITPSCFVGTGADDVRNFGGLGGAKINIVPNHTVTTRYCEKRHAAVFTISEFKHQE